MLEQFLREMIAVNGDLTVRLVVHVPELEALGVSLMAGLEAIVAAVEAQNASLIRHTEAMTEQAQAIVAEMQQAGQAGHVDPAQITALATMMQDHVTALDQQTTQLRANTEQIKTIIADETAPPDEGGGEEPPPDEQPA